MHKGTFIQFWLLVGGYIKLPAMEPVNCARLIGHFSCIERWRKQLLSHGRLGGMKTDKAKGDERGTKECH